MMHDMQNNDILDILYTKKQQTNNDMVGHHNLIEAYPSISLAKSPLWETAPSARFYRMCWAKPTWMGRVVLLPFKMEVRLVIFPLLDWRFYNGVATYLIIGKIRKP